MKSVEPTPEALDKAAAVALTPPIEKQRAHAEGGDEHEHGVDRVELMRIGLVALAVAVSWFQLWQPIARFDLVAWAATIAGAYPIVKEALYSLFARRMTMELSMTIALAAALSIGEAFTALVIVLFVLVAEVLEHLTVDKGRRAIQELVDFLPRGVAVRRNGIVEESSIDMLRQGEVVIVKPGGRVPVDGEVVAGHSFVDQSMVTGESLPVEKTRDSSVFAGTVNQNGVLEIRAIGIGHDTAYARIVEAVERAERTRAPIQKTADRLAGYLVYFALGAALLTFLITRNARATISVVIVAGACGIAAGTPLAILGAIGRAARLGSIIKGGLHLEALGQVDTVVLDKTGTLTLGTHEVSALYPVAGVSLRALLQAAATAEQASEHPLASAVLKRARAEGIEPERTENFAYTPGRGIACSSSGREILVGNLALLRERDIACADGAGNIHVAVDGQYLGAIAVTDTVRPQAAAAVRRLRAIGLHLVLLTGDAALVAESVASELGIESVLSELMPEQKTAEIRRLQGSGRKVAMVGDGINDAAALAEALVGIGMGSGTEIAREAADVVLIGNDLLKLVDTIEIARRCRAIIIQNFVGTLVVDSLGILLAAFNVLNPLLAAFIHVTSELAFILNSTRLLPRTKAIGERPGLDLA
ncbi:MAG TPA: cation-translocating P-type ATPase [Polyangiaceae bacterium]|jgi:Cd2+/Zn2+-exporting ATPase/Cu+-exporting ATPase|nr:cation-translocating P-type ATPase [Polyangiaceae bacterium]